MEKLQSDEQIPLFLEADFFFLSSKLWAQQWAESPISVRRVRGCLANVKSEREAEGNLCFGYFLVMRRSSVKCIRNQMRYAPENLFAPKILRAAARCSSLEVAHLHLGRFISVQRFEPHTCIT